MSTYKLRCTLISHSKDVRSVCSTDTSNIQSIVSGSRDVTARIWTPNEKDSGFTQGHVYTGHSSFVAAVCVLTAGDDAREYIATGSNDNMIHIYDLSEPNTPVHKLEGHTDTVCCLRSGKYGSLISGSWDSTAKVWLNFKSVMTLKGHEAAVWCVAIIHSTGYMITGSADKTLRLWRAGQCEKVLKGHDDCVRGLTVINQNEVLSCSNDSSIRRWSVPEGTALQVYYSHMNYVYGIAMLPNSTDFVSVSEDRSLKVWRGGECVQTITHPTTSVWCVCVLLNGDIVTGSSDAAIRVFTASDDRKASAEDINAFEEQVSATHIPTQVGDIDSTKLPGPEALQRPGKKDGVVVMIKEGDSVEAHQWSAADLTWSKVGNVVGSSGGTPAGRTLHEGKEYDFVFSVDISEGQPPINLPYNMTEDPWAAAQKFITTHGLDQGYLEQVRNFIVENSQSVSMSQQAVGTSYRDPFTGASSYVPGSTAMDTGSTGGYSDPFTGGGRYVPSSGGSTNNTSVARDVPSQGVDPFTGSGSYRPAEASSQPSTNPYFPLSHVETFNAIKPEAALKKLKEFNKQLPGSLKCVDGDLDIVLELCNLEKSPTALMLTYLWRLLQWPADKVFPSLDIMRVALRNPSVNEYFCNSKKGPEVLQYLVTFLDSAQSTTNQMLALRSITNMTSQQSGQELVLTNSENLIPVISLTACKNKNSNLQIAAVTVLMNFAVLFKPSDDSENKSQLLSALSTIATDIEDPEAKFRFCVALGTLVWKDDDSVAMATSLGLHSVIEKWKQGSQLNKLLECCKYLIDLL